MKTITVKASKISDAGLKVLAQKYGEVKGLVFKSNSTIVVYF